MAKVLISLGAAPRVVQLDLSTPMRLLAAYGFSDS
jgi:hypothetical protein